MTLKALAAHPLLCYRFSMTSTSSKAGNQMVLHSKQITDIDCFELNINTWSQGKFLSMCLTQDGGLFTVISTLRPCACFRPLFSAESSQIC